MSSSPARPDLLGFGKEMGMAKVRERALESERPALGLEEPEGIPPWSPAGMDPDSRQSWHRRSRAIRPSPAPGPPGDPRETAKDPLPKDVDPPHRTAWTGRIEAKRERTQPGVNDARDLRRGPRLDSGQDWRVDRKREREQQDRPARLRHRTSAVSESPPCQGGPLLPTDPRSSRLAAQWEDALASHGEKGFSGSRSHCWEWSLPPSHWGDDLQVNRVPLSCETRDANCALRDPRCTGCATAK
jgi:hypothetical protein